MVFSLQKRFLIFLLVPVTLVLLVTGVASFMYARSYLLDEWESAARVRLEKMANEIKQRLDHKRDLIELIVNAENIPDAKVTQAYLAQQLAAQEGVGFVDIEKLRANSGRVEPESRSRYSVSGEQSAIDGPPDTGRRGMMRHMQRHIMMHRMMPGFDRMRGHVMGPRGFGVSLDESGNFLSIVKNFGMSDDNPTKRIVVSVSFSSFMKNILQVEQREGSYACLVTADGKYLAHTDPTMYAWHKLGETGSSIEKEVLQQMQTKHFGTVFGEGHPPDWIVSFYKVPTTEWYVILSSRGSVVLAPIVRFRFNYILAGMVSLICVGLLIRWNTKPVAESVGEISEAAERVEEGDYNISVSEDRTDEIGQLKRRFNKMIGGLKQRELIERTFGRYVDKTVAEELMRRPEALHLGGEKQVVTIMMADLRGFTKTAEKLPSEEVIRILNRYFGRMIAIIERYKGIIVDFFGDSVLVFFNGLDARISERAYHAVSCALAMQRELEVVSVENQRDGLPPLQMGIGIHTGEVVVGNIGSETRAKYGIVGSAVNETHRIQSVAEGGNILISEQTYSVIEDRIEVGPKCQACLKGLDGLRDLYHVRSIPGNDHPPVF